MQLYDEIDYFIAIAQAGNLNHAAKTLFLTPSALSVFLTKLERRLGVTLFIRGKDSLRLTKAGEIYLDSAKKISKIKEDTLRALEQTTAPQEEGIRVGAIGARSLGFAEAVWPIWRKALPEQTLHLVNDTVSPIYLKVADGRLDVGIGAIDYAQQEQYRFVPLCHEEIGLGIPERHPMLRRLQELGIAPEDPADIALFAGETILMNEKGTVIDRTCRRYFRREKFTPRQMLHSLQRTNLQLARITGAVTMTTPGYPAPDGGVVFQRLQDPMYYDQGLIFPQGKELSPALTRMTELAVEHREFF